jgi:transglutaminase-like putative cysteine protease
MKSRQLYRFLCIFILCICLPLTGCTPNIKSLPGSSRNSSDSPGGSDSSGGSTGSRDSTPQVLTPSADGDVVYSGDVSTIDASNASEGYIMVKYKGKNAKVKLQITGPDQITYTYDLHGGYEVFPLTAGNGSYSVAVFENISDNQYATAQSENISITLSNEFGPYLYPNQYVNFNADSLPVTKAASLAASADTDLDVVSAVYNYIIDNFTYDYDKAANVKSGYLPVVDDVFQSQTGICFDYTAVIATMLRTQGIPTRLEVGYMGEQYHSWVSIYTKETGWLNGIIEFDGDKWKMLDPTFASTSQDPESFTTNNSKYTTKYVY